MRICQAGGVDPAELGTAVALPDPALVVLAGASGSGKSVWAAEHYRLDEVVSSDRLRALVGSGEHDLDASADAFALLDHIVAARLRRGLTAVVDTLGLDPARRRSCLELARSSSMPAVAVLVDTDPVECRRRNRARDRPVPAPALEGQLRRMRTAAVEIRGEGWDLVTTARQAQPEASHTPGARMAASQQRQRPVRMGLVLQLSRFPWGEDAEGPARWLAAVAHAAAEAGLQGIALMDHLIQIPQVGSAWEPIPEQWVTLGMLAGLEPGLRLGTLVTPVTFRAPGILAKTVATLDVLSGGRSFCGIGAGWWAREHAGFGLPFPPAPARFDELGVGHRDASRPVATRHQAVPQRAGLAAGNHLLPAAGVTDPGHRRRRRREADAGHRRQARRWLQPSLGHQHAGPQARHLPPALPAGRT